MTTFRQHTPHHISGLKVTAIEDFEKGEKSISYHKPYRL